MSQAVTSWTLLLLAATDNNSGPLDLLALAGGPRTAPHGIGLQGSTAMWLRFDENGGFEGSVPSWNLAVRSPLPGGEEKRSARVDNVARVAMGG